MMMISPAALIPVLVQYRYRYRSLSKVIGPGVNRKLICNFLLVINSNFGRISYCFRDIDAFSFKIVVSPPHHCLTPPSGRTLCNINIICTSLKSTFSWLQFCKGSIFIRLTLCCLPKSRNRGKFRQNWTLLQFKVTQGHRSWCQLKAQVRLPISHY